MPNKMWMYWILFGTIFFILCWPCVDQRLRKLFIYYVYYCKIHLLVVILKLSVAILKTEKKTFSIANKKILTNMVWRNISLISRLYPEMHDFFEQLGKELSCPRIEGTYGIVHRALSKMRSMFIFSCYISMK